MKSSGIVSQKWPSWSILYASGPTWRHHLCPSWSTTLAAILKTWRSAFFEDHFSGESLGLGWNFEKVVSLFLSPTKLPKQRSSSTFRIISEFPVNESFSANLQIPLVLKKCFKTDATKKLQKTSFKVSNKIIRQRLDNFLTNWPLLKKLNEALKQIASNKSMSVSIKFLVWQKTRQRNFFEEQKSWWLQWCRTGQHIWRIQVLIPLGTAL